MPKYANPSGVSLPLAVWLATDEYDGKSPDPYTISATGLLKSPRQIVLGMRADSNNDVIDIAGLLKSRIGNAIHDAVERSWKSDRLVKTLMSLDFPQDIANKIAINPDQVIGDMIPVYLEQRNYKQLGKWKLTGKFDMVMAGQLSDIKSTTTFTYVKGIKDDDYIKQGSFYKWLNPDKITADVVNIDFIFTDWKQSQAFTNNYPPSATLSKSFPLLSETETESWIKERLDLIETLELVPEPDLPHCTDTELWRSESVWKYYKSGQITARSTKNYDNASEAYAHKAKDGNGGLVVEVKGGPTACLYCNVASQCTQKDVYIATGELIV